MKLFMPRESFVASIFVTPMLPVATCGANTAFAQEQVISDANIQILRDRFGADKKLLVAANMELTDAEAMGFWPIYESYQKDLQVLDERLKETILSYADAYNDDKLTDQIVKALFGAALTINEDEVKMRKAYLAKFADVLPGKKVVRYLQIENKIRTMLRHELAAMIPLVE
jgi:hypothetical protein